MNQNDGEWRQLPLSCLICQLSPMYVRSLAATQMLPLPATSQTAATPTCASIFNDANKSRRTMARIYDTAEGTSAFGRSRDFERAAAGRSRRKYSTE